jgi:predicted RNA-binding protein YlxR (DUF448 family)
MNPVRTCVGCRQRANQSDLLRLVSRLSSDSRIVVEFDLQRKISGRGAWLHPNEDCLNQAIQRRAIARALRISVQADTTSLNFSKEQAETMMAKNE